MKHVKYFKENLIRNKTVKIASILTKDDAELLNKWIYIDQTKPQTNNNPKAIEVLHQIKKLIENYKWYRKF